VERYLIQIIKNSVVECQDFIVVNILNSIFLNVVLRSWYYL